MSDALTREEIEIRNEIEEIANITYHRLDALLDDKMITAALQNEAWELIEALVRVLEASSDLPLEKMQKYAGGIMKFSKAMYLAKIVDFPEALETGKYRGCNNIIKLWVAGKDMLKNVP